MFCKLIWACDMSSIHSIHSQQCRVRVALSLVLGVMCCASQAQTPAPSPKTRSFDLIALRSSLTAQLPAGEAVNVRMTWDLEGGNSLQGELLEERKFGAGGGVAAVTYTQRLNEDWYATGTLALGHGGPNWANQRIDLQLSRKWLAQRQLVTSVALYGAAFDAGRSDRGARLSAALYGDLPTVTEVGITFNESHPGGVRSRMPYASAVFGHVGEQLLSLRLSSGREAYQAIGASSSLVDFHSRSLSVNWRQWLAADWGFSAQGEFYRNPVYERRTLGAGLFAQW